MSRNETVIIEKMLDAPVERVWEAWENPENVSQWWRVAGAEKMIITEYDFRPGGGWRQHALLDMGFKVGENNPGVVFREIVPFEKIVLVPRQIDGEALVLIPDGEEIVISFSQIADNQTRLAVTVVRNSEEEWQPSDMQGSVYRDVFDNLAEFVINSDTE